MAKDKNKDVQCPQCGKWFNKLGIHPHLKAHTRRGQIPSLQQEEAQEIDPKETYDDSGLLAVEAVEQVLNCMLNDRDSFFVALETKRLELLHMQNEISAQIAVLDWIEKAKHQMSQHA